MNDIQDKIAITQTQVNVENEPIRKQELQKKLSKLLLQKEIEDIKKRIQKLG
jgi:hypothetical protein